MENWIKIFMIFLEFAAVAYILIILIFTAGWYKMSEFINSSSSTIKKISVVVAIRNEAQNILALLNSLNDQSLPKSQFEIIIIDDDSNDNSLKIVEDFKNAHKDLNLNIYKSDGLGKKKAIEKAITYVSSEIVFSTDGDCNLNKDLLKNYLAFFEENEHIKLCFGGVFYDKTESIQQKIFHMEFASLVASGAGSSGFGLAFMMNAANMAFRYEDYKTIKNKIDGQNYISGDDIFMLHAYTKEFGSQSVTYIKNPNIVVETSSPANVKEFMNQRIRWGSKAKAYKSAWPLLVSTIVLFFNLMLSITLVLTVYKIWFLAVFSLFIFLKYLIDLPLNRNFLKYYKKPGNFVLFFLMEVFYPFYIVISAFFPFVFSFSWKGRDFSK